MHVVLSSRSDLVGKTVSEIDTIRVFNAGLFYFFIFITNHFLFIYSIPTTTAVVAISRQDFPVKVNDLEDVVLCAGDVLVLETTTNFVKEFGTSPHFALVSEKGFVVVVVVIGGGGDRGSDDVWLWLLR